MRTNIFIFLMLLCTYSGYAQIESDSFGVIQNQWIQIKNDSILLQELDYQKEWGNKYFLCKTCYGADKTYCSYDELIWNDHCFRPLKRSFTFSDSIKVHYEYIKPDSLHLYGSSFDHNVGAWVLVRKEE